MSYRKLAGRVVQNLIEAGKATQIEGVLLGMRLAPCVAREWANEPGRRAFFQANYQSREVRRAASNFGRRGDFGRRIIKTIVGRQRERQLHATKGWRSFSIVG